MNSVRLILFLSHDCPFLQPFFGRLSLFLSFQSRHRSHPLVSHHHVVTPSACNTTYPTSQPFVTTPSAVTPYYHLPLLLLLLPPSSVFTLHHFFQPRSITTPSSLPTPPSITTPSPPFSPARHPFRWWCGVTEIGVLLDMP